MTADRTASKEPYFPELDGLRVVAFLVMIMTHLEPSKEACAWLNTLLKHGWISMEVFFAMSGFLISYLLLKERKVFGSISVKNFYMRRILRIWPLYFLVIAAITVMPLFHANPAKMEAYWRYLREMIAPFCLFAGNYAIIANFGTIINLCRAWRFDEISICTVILPFWSLCIEEQFYLVWPWLLKGARLLRSQYILATVLAVASIWALYLLRQFGWYSGHGYTYFYYNTPTHVASIMLGAAMAMAEVNNPGWAKKLFLGGRGAAVLAILAVGYLAMCFWGVSIYECRSSATWLMTLGIFGSGVLLLLTMNWQPLRTFFSNRFFCSCAKLTYAMYVFHFLICHSCAFWIPRAIFNTPIKHWMAHVILSFSLTIVAAKVSWVLLESHMLNLRKYFRRSAPQAIPAPEKQKQLAAV